jgi:VWFA-related protein
MLATGSSVAQQTANPPEAQAHETTPQFRIRAQRNLVVVRVVVRDVKGQTVRNLRKEDFRLLDDGKPQEITSFSVEVSQPKPEAAPARVPPAVPTGAPPPPVAVLQRFVALFFDDRHTDIEGLGRTRNAAWRHVTTSVRPQDRVAILTATGKDQLDFTDDRGKLHDALFRLAARPHPPNGCPEIDDYQAYLVTRLREPRALGILYGDAIACSCEHTHPDPRDPCPPQARRMSELAAAAVWEQAEMQSLYALEAIEKAVRRLAAMPGQRSLVLVSSGFLTLTEGDKIDAIVNRALQQQVIINAIDAAGLYAYVPHRSSFPTPLDVNADRATLAHMHLLENRAVLAYLSADTGGVFFHNSNDFDDGFRQTAAVPEVSYVLTFSPQNVNLNGKFHPLKVTLNTRGPFTIQARRGYFATQAALAGQVTSADELEKVVFSLEERHELPAQVSTKLEKLNEQKSTLTVSIHVNIAGLRYQKEAERSVDKLIFDTALFDHDGKYVTSKEATLELNLKDATLERLSKSGINAQTRFEVGAGTYRVREVVRESESTEMSELNCEVQVPGGSP